MAVELIEDSELSALAPSRLGNKCFVNDDDSYANLTFRGHKYWDKQRAKEVTSSGTWNIDPAKEKDCNYLQDRLTQLQNTIEGRVGSAGKGYKTDSEVRALRGYETDYKNRIASLKCVETKEQASKEAEEKKNIELINKTASQQISGLLPDEKGTTKSNTTKYLLYGVGAIVLVITTLAILKKSN
jgi:hypothetical protein